MQNPIQKFRQSSIVFEKPGIFSENLKTLTSSNYPTVQYVLLKLCTRFYALIFYIFITNSRSKQNLKNPRHTFVDIGK